MKKTLLFIGLGLTAAYAYGKLKVDHAQQIATNIKFKLHKVNSFNLQGKIITLNVDLKMQNNTDLAFNVNSGNLIKLQKLEFFNTSGYKLAEAVKEINNIVLPALGSVNITDVNVVLDTDEIGPVLFNSLLTNAAPNIITKAHITVLGQSLTV